MGLPLSHLGGVKVSTAPSRASSALQLWPNGALAGSWIRSFHSSGAAVGLVTTKVT